MRSLFTQLILLSLSLNLTGQTSINTKEVKIEYSNGLEIFRICTSGCSQTFDNSKEYFWYTDYSKIKSTKGGNGGNLLHGTYKYYDADGNLRSEKNYYLGLEEGNAKDWDSLGNITSQAKYKKGLCTYLKYQTEAQYWVEFVGPIFEIGSMKKTYSPFNLLIAEETVLPDYRLLIKTYYENSGKIKEEYETSGLGYDRIAGKFVQYFENGKIQITGQYYNGKNTHVRDGKWTWFNPDGSIESIEVYKACVEYYNNGNKKVAGSYIFDNENNNWVKGGIWEWYDEEGVLKSTKTFNWDIEVQQE